MKSQNKITVRINHIDLYQDRANLNYRDDFGRVAMTTIKFDQLPSGIESISVEDVKKESIKEAWQGYEAKPEYKKFNKHDMIESMLDHEETDQSTQQHIKK